MHLAGTILTNCHVAEVEATLQGPVRHSLATDSLAFGKSSKVSKPHIPA